MREGATSPSVSFCRVRWFSFEFFEFPALSCSEPFVMGLKLWVDFPGVVHHQLWVLEVGFTVEDICLGDSRVGLCGGYVIELLNINWGVNVS
ncbi:hypothetical protein WICPIJ_009402 [Wickerhamomyces pijperi]|uniref:Uncharacterized protein n=1 Tax=Wickerhamomyces pijperi TaxID=599730 RepID=A0A9P8PMT2_WICPI|nr:hypothetical protein WICPIJ_009402 [Wickerhamomyces pijperi]